jgi:mannose-6-phosphate isomerase-like protein (cupin superfamily)
MQDQANVVSTAVVLALACMSSIAHPEDSEAGAPPSRATAPPWSLAQQATPPRDSSGGASLKPKASLPCQAFTHPPEKPHDPTANFFSFDQLEHYYRVPGEFTYRLTGDQYGFETLSFIITETHPGGGPGLHVHDTEEAHILLQGSAQYQIGDKTITVRAPYVAKVPAGVPHTFINVGTEPFNLVAVFASKHPKTERVGANPLVAVWQSRNGPLPCSGPR